ncbi:hypothetical protein EGW08_004172 [Elysia chlorotica]|uniref:Glutamyl-tRNA(Gln) amidotransferase subunit C, mitochondrial n=1 Tax=Elysia chlorotica TaxID=188477 RepID=A0A433U2Q1_ELYCH|nr:hypothetical protein EGW08_004172 [Elysia chlorotica]
MQRLVCKRLGLGILRLSDQPGGSLQYCANVLRPAALFASKVPEQPTWVPIDHDRVPIDHDSLPEVPEIDLALVEQLERISLVEFNNEAGLRRLREAVKFANQMHVVDTEGVEPMDSVLEDRECYLRSDEVTDGNCVEDVMSNASKVEEQYFVAPPGNIPMKKRDKEHLSGILNTPTDGDKAS